MPSDKDKTDTKQEELKKDLDIPQALPTEEETQIDYNEKMEKEFFDEEDEVIEVNFE